MRRTGLSTQHWAVLTSKGDEGGGGGLFPTPGPEEDAGAYRFHTRKVQRGREDIYARRRCIVLQPSVGLWEGFLGLNDYTEPLPSFYLSHRSRSPSHKQPYIFTQPVVTPGQPGMVNQLSKHLKAPM